MNEAAAQAMTRARAVLILDQPFWGTLALRLEPVQDYSIPTAAVDGVQLFYNPDFFLAQDQKVRLSVVAHEVGHCALEHIGRQQKREHNKFNRACDYALNPVLKESGFTIPDTWLMDAKYRDMSAERIYTLLPNEPGGGAGPGQPGGALDDMRPGPGEASEAERLDAARDWQVAVVQAAMAAKGYGTLPAAIARLVDDIVNPKVDWRLALRRFVTEQSKDDYSWMRPNRHMIVHGIYLPSLYTEAMGDVVIGVDTSGSIGGPTLAAFASEIDDIIQTCRPKRVVVVYCDAVVAGVDEFAQGDPFTINARGGGGTAFKPVFEYIEQHGITPAALVYLTDLMGPTSFPAPAYPVLWCCTTERAAPWGETIHIDV